MSGAVYDRTTNLGLGLIEFNFPNWGDDANENMKILDAGFSVVGVQLKGAWTNNTIYALGDLVVDVDLNSLWRCAVPHTSAASGTFEADRILHPTYWFDASQALHARGLYTTATTYYINDVVYQAANKYAWALVSRNYTSTNWAADVASGALVIITDTTQVVTDANAAKTAAQGSATAAAGSATAAANSATAAATSATNSANSATASAGSATNAANSAATATTQATNAANSATAAQGYATNALTYSNNASTFATNAQNSATAAANSAAQALAIYNSMYPDAVSDGNAYGRKNGAWVDVTEEVPTDGVSYARRNGAWIAAGGGVADVPDAQNYVRTLGSWVIGYTKAAIDTLLGRAPVVPLMTAGVDTTTNWNTLTAAGYYTRALAGVNTNGPTPGNFNTYFFVQTFVHIGTTYLTQIAYPAWDTSWGVWTRSCANSVWGAWERLATATGYVAKAGDTMTGDLSISKISPALIFDKTASGQLNYILSRMATKNRWRFDLGNNSPESGSNVGSEVSLYRYDDAGIVIGGSVLTIARADGIVQMPLGSTTLTQPAVTNNPSVATTAHVKLVTGAAPVAPVTNAAPATDWNTITTPGWHYEIVHVSGANSPPAGSGHLYCQVLQFAGSYLTQIAYPYVDLSIAGGGSLSKGIWYRGRHAGTWSTWRNIAPATAEARNRIVNPAMQISQENANVSSAASVSNVSYYTADQWAGRWSVSPGAIYASGYANAGISSYGMTAAYLAVSTAKATLAGTDYAVITQRIEGIDIADLQWGTAAARSIVLRFNTFASTTGLYSVRISNSAGTRSYVAQFNLTGGVTSTIVLSIPGDTSGAGVWLEDTGIGMFIDFVFGVGPTYTGVAGWQAGNIYAGPGQYNGVSGAGNQFWVCDVGLYADPNNTGLAPVWQMPDEATELRRCQRYFEVVNAPTVAYSGVTNVAMTNTTSGHGEVVPFKIEKRAAPAMAISGGTLQFLTGGVVGTFGFATDAISWHLTSTHTGSVAGAACHLRWNNIPGRITASARF